MCIDFSTLNANTKFDVLFLPCIAGLLGKLRKANYFSTINLATTYHLVRIAKSNMHKTVF